jgi:DNA-binding response OmpR family regulator
MLDLRLGGRVDGLKILEAVRWRWPETLVIILTAHGSLQSAMAAIGEGVDGYLQKPVEPEDIRQAISEAQQRRKKLVPLEAVNQPSAILNQGPFRVDLDKHQVLVNDSSVELTPQEFKLLVHLIQNHDRVVPPPELVKVVRQFEPDNIYEARDIIKWYIHRLRKRVEPEPSAPRYILNVRGVGYTFGA